MALPAVSSGATFLTHAKRGIGAITQASWCRPASRRSQAKQSASAARASLHTKIAPD